ncbi:MAG: hypothetical protein HOI66_22420 [Verrucomicrobia bacterium]|nr:hypothetical protein [Verrucomicrobiota bacterium]
MPPIQQYLEDGNLGTARELLGKHVPDGEQGDLRGWEWRHFWKRVQGDQIWRAKEHLFKVGKIQFSPDNRHLISMGHQSGEMVVWDWIEHKRVRTRHFSENIRDFNISGDGQVVGVLLDGAARLELWDAELRRMVGPESLPDVRVRAFRFSPEGSQIYFNSMDGKAFEWNPSTNERRLLFDGVPSRIWDVSEDGRLLAFQAREKSAVIWDLVNDVEVRRFRARGASLDTFFRPFQGFRLLDSGMGILSVGFGRGPRLWNSDGEDSVDPFRAIFGVATQNQFAISGKHNLIAMASYEHSVNLWSLGSLDSLKNFFGHGTEVWCVDISPDGRYIASGGMNGEVLLWSVASQSESSQIPGGFLLTTQHSRLMGSLSL